jgi:hypothetical protein
VKRDAIKTVTEKNEFIQARRDELQRRAYKIINEKKGG